ncbi:hypothetical protein [Bacillus atrophaeus]|uniref:hypothetical protein n=1 Tax=Bacillus atrophaeus TaxID=1452 RepID=UPI00227F016F|nr:hypothetical protein [Bacillus atrophaeus]MCY8478067.1 hypothetical protein [Bacillus atrophaeus]
MKIFGRVKSLEDMQKKAKKSGWEVNAQDYKKNGSDFVFLYHQKLGLLVSVNTFNGRFFVSNKMTKNLLATDKSVEFKNEGWYLEILEMIYQEIPERFLNTKRVQPAAEPSRNLKSCSR